MGGRLGPTIDQFTPNRYRRAGVWRDGGVLVVGASATGVQLADELACGGRDLIVAGGRHRPAPAATGEWTSGGGSSSWERGRARSTTFVTSAWPAPGLRPARRRPRPARRRPAVELKPDDPTINDHLGDAYAKTGRTLEAEFQWSHARDLKPEPEDLVKIKQKLASGLSEESVHRQRRQEEARRRLSDVWNCHRPRHGRVCPAMSV